MCPTPLSTGYISTAEASLVSIHIMKVGSVAFSFHRKLKWAIIIRAVQVSDTPSSLPCSYQVLPSHIKLFWTHFYGEHLILNSFNPSILCGRSSTHAAVMLTNKWVGNSNSLLLVLYWTESGSWMVVVLELSVRSITTPASSRLIGCSKVLGCGLSMVTSSSVFLSRFIKEQNGFIVVVSHIRVTC